MDGWCSAFRLQERPAARATQWRGDLLGVKLCEQLRDKQRESWSNLGRVHFPGSTFFASLLSPAAQQLYLAICANAKILLVRSRRTNLLCPAGRDLGGQDTRGNRVIRLERHRDPPPPRHRRSHV